jgi:Tol biopolymer transport system component
MHKFFVYLLAIGAFGAHAAHAEWKTREAARKIAGGEGRYFMNPRWSPDGAKLAFTETRYRGLWVINSDGSGLRQVSEEEAAGFGFEWSSDSQALLARVAKFENNRRYNAVKVFDLASNTTQQLTDYRTFMPGLPHWSPANDKVYMFNREQLEVFESGKPAPVAAATQSSGAIHFLKEGRIALGNLATLQYQTFAPLPEQEYLNLVLAPDRSKVAFEVKGGNLHVMNIDGSGLIDLGPGHRPQWSPQSDYLVYMIAGDDGHQFLASDIYLIKSDGSEKTNLTNTEDRLEMNPSWGPGNRVAFDVMEEGEIYVMELER